MKIFLAEDIPPINNPVLPNIANKKSGDAPTVFGNIIAVIVGTMLIIATLLALFQLLQGGFEWITSGGDKTGLENAQHRITNALVGLLIVFAAWAFYLVILQILGLSLVGENGAFSLILPSLGK
ncbi:hypothetical protein HY029_05660 [Candidatus Gottesmanbacteria bacterium]|nr:hypothetical protein [Candidatus Gottesmanbacteria bacterium]